MIILDRPSPHHSRRPTGVAIDLIVLHTTGGSCASALAWFADPASFVSAHYVIDMDGTGYRCVPESRQAWHAGVSEWEGIPHVNGFSLGIELAGRGGDYPAAQLEAGAELVAELMLRYRIPTSHVVGHADVAQPAGRKVDPLGFPWVDFRALLGEYLEGRR
jgi:N-acetylmuramoyl-L-alanine amidase